MTIAAGALLFVTSATAHAQVVDPSLDHLKCYRIKDELHPQRHLADLRNQFGLQPGCVIATPARALCVETDKQIISSPPPPGGGPGGDPAGHFLCYFVRCPTTAAPPAVNVEDQFGRRTVTVDNARLLCAPANKLICGDGQIDAGEACDPGDPTTNVCPGGLPCNADCTCPPGVCCQCPDTCTTATGTICPDGCSPVVGGTCNAAGDCEECPCEQTCFDDAGNAGICREPAAGGPCECFTDEPECVCGDPCDTRVGPGHCVPIAGANECRCRPDEPPDCPCGVTCTSPDGTVGLCQEVAGSTECECRPVVSDCPCGTACEDANGQEGICRNLPGIPADLCVCVVPPADDCPCGKDCVATTGLAGKCRPVRGAPGECACVSD
jgi:hypothetical protein